MIILQKFKIDYGTIFSLVLVLLKLVMFQFFQNYERRNWPRVIENKKEQGATTLREKKEESVSESWARMTIVYFI